MLEDIKQERTARERAARLEMAEQERAAAKDAATLVESFRPYEEVLKQFCAESGWGFVGPQPTAAALSMTASAIWDAGRKGSRIEVAISFGPSTKAGWFTPSQRTFVTTATFVSCASENESRGETQWVGVSTGRLVDYLREMFLILGPPPK